MDKYLLTNIVMPNADESEYRELYFRSGLTEAGGFGRAYDAWKELHFNTWMNAFAAKKWSSYCALGKLYLGIRIRGDFSIEIIGSSRNAAYTRIDTRLSYTEHVGDGSRIYIPVEKAEAYDAVHFILRFRKENPCEIYSMGWFTDAPLQRENTLAIVTCTYKREDYISRTIDVFKDYLEENPELKKRMHLFVIDNGRTLDTEKRHPSIDIIPNINAGGAGGFCRGLIEACRAKENYTRCLFMDDDVEVIPESFYRILRVADYLRPEHEDAMINGAMLELYRRTIFYENLAVQNGLWINQYHSEGNLRNFDDVLRVTEIPDNVFHDPKKKVNAPWYFCCFRMGKDRSINDLPLPVFIRGDDVEWGWRNSGKAIISMNGICVWHAPFRYRVGKVNDFYYQIRNMFIINAMYTEGFKKSFARLISARFRHAVATYDYASARLINRALDDILKGTAIFDEEPEKLMAEVSAIGKEDRQEAASEKELFDVRDRCRPAGPMRRRICLCIRGMYWLFPFTECLIKRPGTGIAVSWRTPAEAFIVRKHMKVYNLLDGTVVRRDFDYKLEKHLRKDFKTKLAEIGSRYDSLKDDYTSSYSRLTSYEFWKEYLQLEEDYAVRY